MNESGARSHVVAVVNSSPDTIEMLRIWLQQAGFVAVATSTWQIRDGLVDLEAFLRQHGPAVLLYDIAPPYDANWRLFQHLMESPGLKGLPYVLTSTNAARVKEVAHVPVCFEVVGKPYDLDEIVRAVQRALDGQRPCLAE